LYRKNSKNAHFFIRKKETQRDPSLCTSNYFDRWPFLVMLIISQAGSASADANAAVWFYSPRFLSAS
jgi:hypothetical protein